jgi:NAD(P)-dependent dehydrogenase (short-subunit alcohol dehydrogenase family)
MVATSAARAGLLNLVRSMATEFAPQGVRVNGILIGLVESGQWRRRFEAREDKSLDWAAWSAQLARKNTFRWVAWGFRAKPPARSFSGFAARVVHDRQPHRCFRRPSRHA